MVLLIATGVPSGSLAAQSAGALVTATARVLPSIGEPPRAESGVRVEPADARDTSRDGRRVTSGPPAVVRTERVLGRRRWVEIAVTGT